jgi:hypothetical protein
MEGIAPAVPGVRDDRNARVDAFWREVEAS